MPEHLVTVGRRCSSATCSSSRFRSSRSAAGSARSNLTSASFVSATTRSRASSSQCSWSPPGGSGSSDTSPKLVQPELQLQAPESWRAATFSADQGFPNSGAAAGRLMIGGMGTFADAGDAPVAPGHTPYLPEPTGPCPVGTTSLYLKDASRPDPWAAGVSARELMVSLWYPATPSDGRRARYMTPAESELLLTSRGLTSVPQDVLSTVRTNAVSDATPAGRQRSLPLLVLSPGFTMPRSTLTALAEDLASHGYVVAGVDHTYESDATAFPDGRVTTCLARQAPRSGRAEKVVAGRAADVSFVLGPLTRAHPALPGAAPPGPSRLADAGPPGPRPRAIPGPYVRAFFDNPLRSKPQALLDQPSPRYPEVTFCSPETKTCA